MRRALASGPILVVGVHAVADLQRLRRRRRTRRRTRRRRFSWTRKRVGDTQTWPALRNFAADQQLRRLVDVGIVEDDHRRVAAELHRDPLHVRAGERGELLADRRRAREGDLADHRMRDQVLRDLRRDAEDEADDVAGTPASRKARTSSAQRAGVSSGAFRITEQPARERRRRPCGPPG